MDLEEEKNQSKRDEKFGLNDYRWLVMGGEFGKGGEEIRLFEQKSQGGGICGAATKFT